MRDRGLAVAVLTVALVASQVHQHLTAPVIPELVDVAPPVAAGFVPNADLAVTQTHSPDFVVETFTLFVTVTNHGPDTATGVSLTDILPTDAILGDALPSGCMMQDNAQLQCSLGTLAKDASATVVLDFANRGTSSVIENTASVTADQTDLNTANNSDTHTVSAATPGIIASVAVSDTPAGVAASAATTRVYAVINGGGAGAKGVAVIHSSTNTLLTTIVHGSLTNPVGVVFNSNLGRVYVVNFTPSGNGSVSVFDMSDHSFVTSVTVGGGPRFAAVNMSTNRVYVANDSGHSVTVIDGATNTVVATVPVLGGPAGVAVNPTTNRIYVPAPFSDVVRVIDGSSNTVVASIGLNGMACCVVGVDANPNTNKVYVANVLDGAESGEVSVIDGATNTVTGHVAVGHFPRAVAVNSARNVVYAGTDSPAVISVIDAATENVTKTIALPGRPFLGAVSTTLADEGSAGGRLYVSDFDNKAVLVIGNSPGLTHLKVLAKCGTELLPGAKVELFSGRTLVDTETANEQGEAHFQVAPGDYAIRISKGQTTCGTAATVSETDDEVIVEASAAVIDHNNPTWPLAKQLNPSGTPAAETQHLYRQDQSAWFKFPAQPDSKVIVLLTGTSSPLPANYDLTLYKDIKREFDRLTSPSTETLVQLGAEYSPDAFSPDAFSPDAFSPDAFSPDAFSPDAFSPDAFSPDAFSPDAFSPDAFSPDAFSPDAFSPDAFSPDAFSPDAFSPDAFSPDAFSPDAFSPDAFSPDTRSAIEANIHAAYSFAQMRSLIGVSAFEGTAGEGLIRNTYDNGVEGNTFFYVRVRGRNGAFSLSAPFKLQVIQLTGQCGPVAPVTTASTTVATAGSYKTLVLTDLARTPGTAQEKSKLQTALAAFIAHPKVQGKWIDLGSDAKVVAANQQADANPNCPFAKTMVALAVEQVIDKYWEKNPLEYLVLFGGRTVIPEWAEVDEAGLAPAKNYLHPVAEDTSARAYLEKNLFPSDDRYASRIDLSIKNQRFPLVELASGRVMRTAAQMKGYIDMFLNPLRNGVVTPSSAFVSGYDFMADGASAVRHELVAELGSAAVAALIQPGNDPPTAATAWTAAEFHQRLLGQRRDLAYVVGHANAFGLLAADYTTRFSAAQVLSSPLDLAGAVWFGQGCNLSYDPDEGPIPGVTPTPTWTEVAARKQITLIAGQSYQYGETEFVEYGELLYLKFVQALRAAGTGSVGKALVAAKRDYLARLSDLRGIHKKQLLEVKVLGIPHLEVNLGAPITPSADPSDVGPTTVYAADPGSALGLSFADFTVTPTLTPHAVPLENVATGAPVVPDATYLSATDGIVVNPAEPVLPLELRNVSVAGTVLRGVGFRAGSYADTTNVRPLTGAPATEVRGIRAPFLTEVLYPIRPWGVNYFDALSGGGGATRLAVTPAQFVSSPPGSDTGIRRAFSSLAFRLFYSNNTTHYQNGNVPALSAPPAIASVSAVPLSPSLKFDVSVVGDPAAGIQEVWVTYTGTSGPFFGQWQSLDLQQDANDSRRWTGTLSLPGNQNASDVRFIVQGVNGVGLVTLNTNLGAYFRPTLVAASTASPKQPTSLAFQAAPPTPTSGAYREPIDATALLTNKGAPLVGKSIVFGLGDQRHRAVTDANGKATATFSLFQAAGSYDLTASFEEDDEFLASSTAQAFSISKRGTSLTLEALPPSGQYSDPGSVVVTLRDTSAKLRTLRERSVLFVARGKGRLFSTIQTTDFAGRARLGLVPLPSGTYTLTAYFGQTVTLSSGQVVDLTDDRYGPSTASATLVVLGDLTCSDTITSTTNRNVRVPAGAVCTVGADVNGNFYVEGRLEVLTGRKITGNIDLRASGASASIQSATVEGNILATEKATVRLSGADVAGNVLFEKATSELNFSTGMATFIAGNLEFKAATTVTGDGDAHINGNAKCGGNVTDQHSGEITTNGSKEQCPPGF